MTAIDQLKSVLCDPEGKCCIAGSDEDRAIIDCALEALAQPMQEPLGWIASMAHNDLRDGIFRDVTVYGAELDETVPIYTTPPLPPLPVQPEKIRIINGVIHTLEWTPQVMRPAAQPQPVQERNFCQRCGKRTADLTAIQSGLTSNSLESGGIKTWVVQPLPNAQGGNE